MVGLAIVAAFWIWNNDRNEADPFYKAGRYLYVRVSEPKSADVISYAGSDTSGKFKTFQITRENPDTKLAMINVSLHNPASGQLILLIDEAAAVLLTEDGRSYAPINIIERSLEVTGLPDNQLEKGFVGIWKTRTINAGETLQGWMVFEIPKDAGYREFRWLAADRLDFKYN
jgi:hypothetical protein